MNQHETNKNIKQVKLTKKLGLFKWILIAFVGGAGLLANAKEKIKVTRTMSEGLKIEAILDKAIFKTESYQDSYTVEVPYQATETYEVQVPYTATETYEEQVPYETQETYTERVPYQERVAYTDYEEYWEREEVCHNNTRYEQQCRDEQLCEPRPGQCRVVRECSPDGRQCKEREVCDRGERECRTVRNCRDVPVTERECRTENIRKTRPVTKYRYETSYRDELRTRTVTQYRSETRQRQVTKYRTETRQRVVTKYRTEERCCKTYTREVFDHNWTLPVVVEFPTKAELLIGESEEFNLELAGTESSPQATLKFQKQVFQYKVISAQLIAGKFHFVLDAEEPLSADNAGAGTVTQMALKFSAGQAFLVFDELILNQRVHTQYQVTLTKENGEVLSQSFEQDLKLKKQKLLLGALEAKGRYQVALEIKRSGTLLKEKEISFSAAFLYEKKGVTEDDLASLSDKSLVRVELFEATQLGVIEVIDETLMDDSIETIYKPVIWSVNPANKSDIKWLAEKKFSRAERVSKSPDQRLLFDLVKDLGVTQAQLGQLTSQKRSLFVALVVERKSEEHLGSNKKIQMIIEKRF